MSEDLERASGGVGIEEENDGEFRSDWSETGVPSTAVIEAVATATDTAPTELPPLTDAVDPDGLDRLLRSAVAVRVSFEYDGVEVFVAGDGTVEVGGQD